MLLSMVAAAGVAAGPDREADREQWEGNGWAAEVAEGRQRAGAGSLLSGTNRRNELPVSRFMPILFLKTWGSF